MGKTINRPKTFRKWRYYGDMKIKGKKTLLLFQFDQKEENLIIEFSEGFIRRTMEYYRKY